jgi:hypothetical protein
MVFRPLFDLGDAVKYLAVCIFVFSVVMFGLGKVFTGDGAEGWHVVKAQDHCERTGASGVDILELNKTHVCK